MPQTSLTVREASRLPDIAIRRCTSADAEAVAALSARLFVQAYGPTHPEPEMSRYLRRSFAPGWFARELAKLTVAVLVVEDSARVAHGYVHLQLTTERAPAGVVGQRPVEIARFYVDEAWHGRGVAQALMAACDVEASVWGGDVLWLAVWQEAARPFAFYRKCGFSVAGVTTFQFGERRDTDYVMTRAVRTDAAPRRAGAPSAMTTRATGTFEVTLPKAP